MKSISNKFISTLLALALVFGLFAAMPMTARAADMDYLKSTIDGFDHGGTGKLAATVSGNTMTVTGTVTGVADTLYLDIGPGLTVIWKAMYSALESSPAGANLKPPENLIIVTGDGTFEVAAGGSLMHKGGGNAVKTSDGDVTVVVSGGSVSATGTGAALFLEAGDNTVTVSGGTVEAAGAGPECAAVYADSFAAANITVNGGTVKNLSGNAIISFGDHFACAVKSGTVTSGGEGSAIRSRAASSVVNVSGGIVSASGTSGSAVFAVGDKSVVTVSGGSVSTLGTSQYCHTLYTEGVNSSITVSGGSVSTAGLATAAIYPWGENSTVTVSGGTVSATGNSGFAVYSTCTNITVKVSGGFLFCPGTIVARTTSILTSGTLTISGNPVLCVWNKPESGTPVYNDGTSDDLNAGPSGASTKWDKSGSQSGINYVNGANTGFFPIDGVIVANVVVKGSLDNFQPNTIYKNLHFTDVDENAWYGFSQQKVIARAFEYGLMKGTSVNRFNPTGNVTIAEAITVAARVHSIYMTGTENFVQGSPWYQVYIDYAVKNGIIKATDFTNYNVAATRAQMAYIFAHCLPDSCFPERASVKTPPDVNTSTPYFSEILTLYRAGVLGGSDDKGTFHPARSITRAEAAAVIARVILPDTRFGVLPD